MDKIVSTKFETMFLVSGSFLDECTALKNKEQQEEQIPTTEPAPPPAEQFPAGATAFVCEELLGNSTVCGQAFDTLEQLDHHKNYRHGIPSGVPGSSGAQSQTLAETVMSTSLGVSGDTSSDPPLDTSADGSTLVCHMCGFRAKTKHQLDTHFEKHLDADPANPNILAASRRELNTLVDYEDEEDIEPIVDLDPHPRSRVDRLFEGRKQTIYPHKRNNKIKTTTRKKRATPYIEPTDRQTRQQRKAAQAMKNEQEAQAKAQAKAIKAVEVAQRKAAQKDMQSVKRKPPQDTDYRRVVDEKNKSKRLKLMAVRQKTGDRRSGSRPLGLANKKYGLADKVKKKYQRKIQELKDRLKKKKVRPAEETPHSTYNALALDGFD